MKKAAAATLGAGIFLLIAGLILFFYFDTTVRAKEQSVQEISAYMAAYTPAPFTNTAMAKQPPQAARENIALHTYYAPEGIIFSSHSEAWDEAGLELLYAELLQNRHGDEIETLQEVVVRAEGDLQWAAQRTPQTSSQLLELDFGALPQDFQVSFVRDVSVIELYGGDQYTTVESMAPSLSHEYGHLYTHYYLFDFTNLSLGDTRYAELRESEENGLIASSIPGADYADENHRYLFEVAAEDYVQLMGSPTTRTVAEYVDIRQQLAGRENPDEVAVAGSANAWPQENLTLPLASEVPGLADYFYSFIGQTPPAPQQERQEIVPAIQAGSAGYNLVDGYQTFLYHTISWDTPYEDAIYTVVCYDPEEYSIYPIKTVRPGENATATIGTVTSPGSSYVSWMYDELDRGTKIFLVVAQLPDGTYYLSEPLEHTF